MSATIRDVGIANPDFGERTMSDADTGIPRSVGAEAAVTPAVLDIALAVL
jgi:hypothetical protein